MNENVFIFGIDSRRVSIIQRFIGLGLCDNRFVLPSGPPAVLACSGCSEGVVLPVVEESVALGFVVFSRVVFHIDIVVVTISICKLGFDESTVIVQVTVVQIVQVVYIVDVVVVDLSQSSVLVVW